MKKGFTLIELLVVVLIIGILSSVALPQYEKAVEKSRWSEAMTNTKKLGEALEVFKLASGGALPTAISDLDVNVGTQVAGSPLSALAGKFRYTVGGSGDIVGNWEGRANTEKNYMNIVYSTNDHYLYCKLKSETTNSTAWSICKSWSNGCANRVTRQVLTVGNLFVAVFNGGFAGKERTAPVWTGAVFVREQLFLGGFLDGGRFGGVELLVRVFGQEFIHGVQLGLEVFARVGLVARGHLARRTGHHDLATFVAAFGAQVNEPVGRFDNVQIVLNDKHGIAFVRQAVQHMQQFINVCKVKPGGGLVQNIQRFARAFAGQFIRQFNALCFPARKRGGGLTELNVAQPYVV